MQRPLHVRPITDNPHVPARRARLRAAAAGCAALMLLSAGAAHAAVEHDRVVSENAADYTPQLVASTAVPQPRADAISSVGATTYAGGRFERVSKSGQTFTRHNLVAFDTFNGSIRTGFAPVFDKQVRAVEHAADGGVYVGGDFTTVNGTPRRSLVKLTPSGAIDTTFKPPFKGGLVYEIERMGTHLIVSGSAGKKLMSLNPTTGAYDGYIDLPITGEVCVASGCSWGSTAVYDFAVHAGTSRLVAVGNFDTVAGQSRSKFFMLNLADTGAKLAPWYYPGFAKRCATDHPRRIAYLQGIDFNPSGSAFNVAATGQITASTSDIWYHRLGDNNKPNTTVCDAVGRFNVADASKPAWINYTGGDSVWEVADTGRAVYATGHFQWMDNPDGYASMGIGDKTSGRPAAQRYSIAAIDPQGGLALPWDPPARAQIGGKALEATTAGLWVGSDSSRFGSEAHRGLAFVPD